MGQATQQLETVILMPSSSAPGGGISQLCGTSKRANICAGNEDLMAMPNPSFEARPNGKPPGPPAAFVYHAAVGPGVLPSVPPQLKR